MSKYVRASFELPWAKLVLARETSEEMGVSAGMSEGESAWRRLAWRTRGATRAKELDRRIILESF